MQVEDGMKSLKEYVLETRVAEGGCPTDQRDFDIGGFANIAGCLEKLKKSEKQLGRPLEEDLASWGHHSSPATVPDVILQASAGDEVSFVFTNQVGGKLVPVEPMERKSPVPETILMKPLNPSSALSSRKVVYSSNLVEYSSNCRTSSAFPPQKMPKFPTTAKHTGTNINSVRNENISHKNRLPVKRISAEIDDDDFV